LIQLIESDPLLPGANYYRAIIALADGTQISSRMEVVYFADLDEVIVFPNPVSSFDPVTILSGSNEIFDVQILDMTGKEWMNYGYSSNPVQVSLNGLPVGIYLVVIRYDNGMQIVRKIAIE
jgi:hypothetical protein